MRPNQASHRQLAGEKWALEGVYIGFDIGANGIIGRRHALSEKGNLDRTQIDKQMLTVEKTWLLVFCIFTKQGAIL